MILAIETSTTSVGVALGRPGEILSAVRHGGKPRHGELLAPAVQLCVERAGLGMEDIEAIGVDVGPGLFTGLRVGISAAKAFGFALGRPVCALNSLDVLAWPLRWWPGRLVAVLDGRKGQCFWASYGKSEGGWGRSGGIGAGPPQDLAEEIGRIEGEVAFVGDGALRYAGELGAGVRGELIGDPHPGPEAALELAAAALERGDALDAMAVQALYLRAPDAEVSWRVELAGPGEKGGSS